MLRPTAMPCCRKALAILSVVLRVHFKPVIGSPAVSGCISARISSTIAGVFFRPAAVPRPACGCGRPAPRPRAALADPWPRPRRSAIQPSAPRPNWRASTPAKRRKRSSHNAATSTIAAFTSSDTPAGATSGSINLPSSAARAASCRRRIAASVEQYRYPCETRSRETRPCCVNRSNDSFAPTWSNASSSLEKYPRSASRMHCSKVAIKVPCFENHTDRADHKPCWSNSMSSFKA